MSENICINCGADLDNTIYNLEPEENDVLREANWGRHPSFEEEGECPECHCKFSVTFETYVSVDINVNEITMGDPTDVPPHIIEAFFAQSPSEYKFPGNVDCEHCKAHLTIQGRTAKEVMDNGMRVAMEFPRSRVTCQKCNPANDER